MRTRLALGAVALLVLALAPWLTSTTSADAGDARADTSATQAPARGGTARRALQRSSIAPVGSEEDEELLPRVTAGPQATDAGTAADAAGFDAMADVVRVDAMRAWLRLNAAAAEKYVDRYCAEAARVSSLEPTAPSKRTRDAALFMAGRSDWEEGRVGLLHLPASLTHRMGNPPLTWRTFTPADYAGLDFGWMRELLAYDHWSLTAQGPLKHVDVMSGDTPTPNYVTLQFWVKLRFVKGFHENDLAQASLEVRHLGALVASSGTLVGEMIRVSFFGIERGVYEGAGLPAPPALPSADDGQRIRHTAFAGMYFLFPGVPRAVQEKALKCVPTRCAAVNEALIATAALRDVVPSAGEHLEWLQAQSPCDPVLAARAARGPALSAEKLLEDWGGNRGVERSMQPLLDGGR